MSKGNEKIGLVAYAKPGETDGRAKARTVLRPSVDAACVCGCAPYTQAYESLFPHSEYWALDRSPRRQRFGSKLHIVDRLEALNRYAVGPFDLIICNGVLGWGIRDPEQAEAAICASHAVLAPGGCLLLGWNDVAPRNRVRPEHVVALAAFTPAPFARFDARVRVPGGTATCSISIAKRVTTFRPAARCRGAPRRRSLRPRSQGRRAPRCRRVCAEHR